MPNQSNTSPPRSLPVEPREGNYVVKLDEAQGERTTESGIIIPETESRSRVSSGVVQNDGDEFSVGDRVYFSPYCGYELVVGGTKFVQLGDSEVLGRFTEDADVRVS